MKLDHSKASSIKGNDNQVSLIKDNNDIKVYRHYTVCGSEVLINNKPVYNGQTHGNLYENPKKDLKVKELLTSHFSADIHTPGNKHTTCKKVEIISTNSIGNYQKRDEHVLSTDLNYR